MKGSASRDGAWRIQNGFIFFQNDKANFIAAREIVIEFVFRLCENEFVPGSVTRPTGRIQ